MTERRIPGSTNESAILLPITTLQGVLPLADCVRGIWALLFARKRHCRDEWRGLFVGWRLMYLFWAGPRGGNSFTCDCQILPSCADFAVPVRGRTNQPPGLTPVPTSSEGMWPAIRICGYGRGLWAGHHSLLPAHIYPADPSSRYLALPATSRFTRFHSPRSPALITESAATRLTELSGR